MTQSDDGFAGTIGLLMVAGIWFFISNNGWSNSLWYSFKYDVGIGDVQTDPRPTDCDFLTAPLGIKSCSYTAHARGLNANGIWVAGDNDPLYGYDTKTGKPIISHDNGKAWDWYEGANFPDPKPTSVRVFWVKEVQ